MNIISEFLEILKSGKNGFTQSFRKLSELIKNKKINISKKKKKIFLNLIVGLRNGLKDSQRKLKIIRNIFSDE